MIRTSTFSFTKISFLLYWLILVLASQNSTAQAPGGISANLRLWLKADSGVTPAGQGAAVTTWNDQSGGSNNAVYATPMFSQTVLNPTYQPNSLNFNPAVRFSGTSNTSFSAIGGTLSPAITSNNISSYAVLLMNTPTSSSGRVLLISQTPTTSDFQNQSSASLINRRTTNIIYQRNSVLGPQIGPVIGKPILTSTHFTTANQALTEIDGNSFTASAYTTASFNSAYYRLGLNTTGAVEWFNGDLAEVILYDADQSSLAAHNQIESYLALKYGIHKVGNYVSSSNSTTWDASANAAYHNDVFGIGQDDTAGLLQIQSNSTNTGSGDGTGQSAKGNIIISNASSLVNNSFLIVGHNTGSLAEINGTVAGGLPIKRVERLWKAQTTGTPGNITLSYDITGLSYSAQSFNDYVLLVDPTGTGDFTGGSVVKYPAVSLTANKVSFDVVTLPAGSVFTFQTLAAPTTQATNVTFTNTTGTSTTASWINGNGSSRAVFMYAGTSGSAVPVDFTTYAANPAFGAGDQIGTTGWYCVYYGVGTTVNITGLTPAATYQVMVVERNGTATNEMYLTAVSTGNPAGVTTLSNDATLSNLTLSQGTLAPVFASGTTAYTATVSNAVTSLIVTPTTTNTSATVTVNGTAVASGSASGSINLAVGPNVITTVVTAQDGTTLETYTITVTRANQIAPGGISGEVIWYKANEGITLNGTNVSQWNDFSGNANNGIQGTAASQPAYTANSINFNQTVTFTGSNYLTAPVNNLPAGNTARSIFIVASSSNTQPGASWIYGYGTGSTGRAFNIGKVAASTTLFLSGFSVDTQSTSNFWTANVPKLGAVTYNSPTVSFFDAGTPIGTASQAGYNTLVTANSGRIGAFVNSGGEIWRGNIAEIILYPSLITGNNAAKVESYLAMKYGIHKSGDYVDATGTVVWSATTNAAYHNDVFGLAHDGLSDLLQTQSNSVNTGNGDGIGQSGKGNIIIGTISPLVDNSFLIIGHDTNSLTEINLPITGGSTVKAVERKWKAQTTGTPGNITLSYDITGLSYSAQSFNDYVLLVDPTGTGDFTGGTVVKYPAVSLTANKVSFGAVTLPTGSVFTFQTLAAPTTQATNVTFTNTTGTSTTASWTNGNGSSRAVFMYAGTSGSAVPVDFTTYAANPAFGTGDQIGTTGWYCVYYGVGTTVNITGLTPAATYQVMVVERNGTATNEMYLTAVSTGNPAGVTTLSNDATLSNLTLSQGTLAPVFASGTTAYTATVSNAVTSLTVTPTTTNTSATVTVNGTAVASGSASAAINLAVGPNVITTVVTAQDGTTLETYTITVNRVVAPPIITSFNPESGPVGTTVVINGANFSTTATQNIVFFGATHATVTAATTTSLTVTVPAGASYQPISVLNGETVLAGYSAGPFITTFSPNKGRITIDDFDSKVDFTSPGYPGDIEVGDLDGDGKADLTVISSSNNTISIFPNISTNGTINTGSFGAKLDFSTGRTPLFTVINDFDGDGKLDVATVNYDDRTISVLRNNSSGIGNFSFAGHVTFPLGNDPEGITMGDLDGDGKVDLIVMNYADNNLSVLRNTSSGIGNINFAPKADFTVNSGPTNAAIADFDGDGIKDIVVCNYDGSSVSILRNISTSGTIAFAARTDFTTAAMPYDVAIGDFNKDNKTDFVVTNRNASSVSVFRNSSSGSGSINFDGEVTFTTSTTPYLIAVNDLDGDGNLDVAVSSQTKFLSILRNTSLAGGAINFAPKVDFGTTNNTSAIAIGDLDGDGKNDLMTANSGSNTISVFRNNPLFAPTVQATDVVFTNTTGTTTIASWTNGNGSSRAVFMYAGTTGSPVPVDLTTYAANPAFGTGDQIGTSGWYCIYYGTGTTVNITGLTSAANYRVMIVERNGSAGDEMYLTSVGTGNPANITTLNNVATLNDLSINQGTLNPVFATATTSYTATVANAVTSLTVTPTTTDSNATIMVNGTLVVSGNASGAINLAVGQNIITTVVTAQDGVTTETYTITVTRTSPPTIVTTGTLSALTTVYGTASASGSFNVSGTDMLEGVIVAPPAGFEVSSDNINFGETIAIGGSAVITDIPIYIRLKGTIAVGSYSGDVVLTSNGAATVNVPTVLSTVTPAPLTITADNKTKVYGDSNPALTVSYSGFVNGDTAASLATPPTITTTATTASAVGSYPITASGAVNPNYTIAYIAGNLNVTVASLTLTADDKTRIYGSANPTFTGTYVGFVNGETEANLSTQPTYTTSATVGSPVGDYPIIPSGAASPNYVINYVYGNLELTAATLTITAENKSKAYGDTNPTLTVTYSGFVNGDDATSLTTPPTITTTAVTGSSAGSYPITASGALNPNYTISYVDGTLTVTPVALTITADNQTKAYGDVNPALTVTYSGFVNGDDATSLTTPPTITTTADATSPVGSYPITASGAVNPNYTISYVDGTLTITPVALTITAENKTKVYGDVNPVLTASYSGFVNGDDATSLTTPPTISTTAVTGSAVGNYPITASGAVNPNYTIGYVDGTLTVTPVALTITADNKTKSYGDANPVLTASYSGFVNGDDVTSLTTPPTITTTAVTGSAVGNYPITASGAVNPNYIIGYVDGTLTVTPVVLTITAENKTKVYGDTNPVLTASYSGFVNGDDATSLITPPTISTTAVTGSAVGSYPITASGAVNPNYTISYVAGTLTVTPVALTITAENKTKVYGDTNPVLTASYSGFVNGDDATSLTTPPTIATTAVTGSAVGSYPITASGAVNPNYTFSYVDGTLTVTPVALTITADNKTKAYGDANPALTVTYSGFVNGDDATSLTTPPTIATTAVTGSAVGSYPITASGAVNPNYTIGYVDGTLTVTPVVLTITAENKSKAYGDANPTLTVTYSGFVNGDDATSLTTPPTIATTADATSSVGSYPITASGAVNPNYTISYVDGTLTVTPVALTITADNKSKAYGDTNPALTVTYSGFVNGDTETSLTTPPTITTTAVTGSPVGSYPITASGAVNLNYTISYVDGTLTVTPVALTITADNKTKSYGDTNPALTVTYSGFVNGDTETSLTTPPTISTTAVTGSIVGSYSITASGAVNPNYTISYVDGTLTVTPVILTITADNKTKAYGDTNPVLTASYSGFVNGDDATSLTTPPTISTTADATSLVGNYPITASGAVNPNYTISYVDGTLTVTPVALTITAENKSKAYGDANPALTVTYSGFVNGDTESSFTTPPTISTTAVTGSPVGSYPITASGAVNPNYTISYVDGTLTITPVALTITAENKSKSYGDANPVLTVTYSGFVNGDDATSLTTPPTIATTADATSPVGSYPITASGAVNPNYTISYVDGTLTVTPVILTITAENKSKSYGDANPTLTVTYSGFVNGDDATSLTTPPTIATTAVTGSAVGSYPITASGAVNPNYTISYVDGTLTVTPVALTITAENKSKSYGDANPTLTVTYSGFVNGDDATSLTTPPTISTTAVTGSAVGSYPITASGAVNPNYTISYVDGTLTITPVALTITAENKSKAYGDTNPVLTASYSGFVNGDDATSLTTPPTITTTAVTGSSAGSYPITASGALNPNYTIGYLDGTLTVTPVTLTITADNKTKAYGDTNPTLTVTYSGFVNGDDATSLTTPPTIVTTAGTGSPVGSYPITTSGAVNLNYTISYVDGTLTVTPVALTITADNKSKAYGNTNPVLTATYSGFVNGDTESSFTTPPTISTTAVTGSAVGNYPITASGAVNPNYTIVYVDGNLTVTAAILTIIADDKTRVFGAPNPPLTASYSGFVNGDTAASLTTLPILATIANATSPVGVYAITVNGAADPNYNITYVTGVLTVTSPADVSLTSLTVNNGTLNPAFSPNVLSYNVSVSSNITTETITAVADDPLATITINGVAVAGGTPDTVALGPGQNTVIVKVVGQDGVTTKSYTLNITRASANIATLSNLTISSGTLNPAFASNVTQYDAVVKYDVSSVTVVPTVTDPTATVTVNGAPVSSGTASASIMLSPGENTIETVVTAQDGITKQTYTIVVYKGVSPNQLVVNNILSPNGDGKNDFWLIEDIELFPNNIVTVYDRAGRIVYSKKSYSNEWDGSYSGSPLNNDTYYYLIDLGDNLPKIKGFITIIRD